ncbi:hypothetical protein R0J93_26455, partial [Pseudoalteromonas sp. SIMBA_148]
FGSNTILTGIRWVILVKLPVAFSLATAEKALLEAGAMLSTWPVKVLPGRLSEVVPGIRTRR